MNMKQRMAWLFLPCFLGLLPLSNAASAQIEADVQNAQERTSNETSASDASDKAASLQDESVSENGDNSTPTDEAEPTSETGDNSTPTDEAEPTSENGDNSTPVDGTESTAPESAETATPREAVLTPNNRVEPETISTNLPVSTAVVVTFCSPVRFDSKQKQAFPATAVLSHPISDQSGTVVAPIRSLANLQIQPKRGMVEMQVSSLIVDGRLVPIQTGPLAIPVLSRTHPDAQNTFFDSSSVPTEGAALNVVNNLQSWISTQGLISDGVSDLLGVGLSVASGITSAFHSPQGKKVSELPPGVSLIFALDTPVRLPAVHVDPSYALEQAGTNPCQQGTDGSSDDYSGASSSFDSDESY
jgi:hypothetical protein